MPAIPGHEYELMATLAQTREGTIWAAMTYLTTDSTLSGLMGIPNATIKIAETNKMRNTTHQGHLEDTVGKLGKVLRRMEIT